MNLETQLAEIRRLDDLINRKATDSLDELAEKFKIGRSTMKRHLKSFKEQLDAPVAYDREVKFYYYTKPFNLASKIEAIVKGREKNS